MRDKHVPKKRFGQNFLIDHNVIAKIVSALHPTPSELIVEIGAGLGALTQEILHLIPHLHVIEIDRDLGAKLTRTFSPSQLTVHQQDALEFDFNTLAQTQSLRVFGNLPYNISTPLLFHLLTFAHHITDMLFMLQKEVVMRMAALPNSKDYGRLSVMIQYYCEVQTLFDVHPKSFSPPPKVMSSIVKLTPYTANRPFAFAHNEKMFATIVRAAFSQRRKTLRNALNGYVNEAQFEQLGISMMRRAETLSVSEFIALSNACATEFAKSPDAPYSGEM